MDMTMVNPVKLVDRDRRPKAGAVLLETILAIPLLIIMLGGIFWIGDLTLTRQQLMIADRYVAWNRGVRYDDRGQTDAGVIHQLFFSDRFGIPSQYHTPILCSAAIQDEYDWSHVANGKVCMKVQMPDWVYSMIHAANIQFNRGDWMKNDVKVKGREQVSERHVILMRTKREAASDFIRNKYGVKNSGEISTKWNEIADEKWPYE